MVSQLRISLVFLAISFNFLARKTTMDTTEIVKLKQQVRNKYKKREFFDTLILYCFTVLSGCLLLSTPFWLPSLVSSIKAFIFVSVPSIGALLFTPKCLFVACNIIIVFLIGESKYVGSSSSIDNDIYHEYVKRTATIVRTQPKPEKQEVAVDTKLETIPTIVEEKEVIMEEQGNEEERKQVEDVKQDEIRDDNEEEEDVGLPTEELNKKFDDFIAKVRNQRRLEARQLVCV